MKTFIASIITFFIILFSILVFVFFLNSSINEFTSIIDNVIYAANNENWLLCEENFKTLKETWERKKTWYELFITHKDTDLIGEVIASLEVQTKFNDKKQVLLYASRLKILFEFIYDDEIPTLENII